MPSSNLTSLRAQPALMQRRLRQPYTPRRRERFSRETGGHVACGPRSRTLGFQFAASPAFLRMASHCRPPFACSSRSVFSALPGRLLGTSSDPRWDQSWRSARLGNLQASAFGGNSFQRQSPCCLLPRLARFASFSARGGSRSTSRIHPRLQRLPDLSVRPLKVVLVGRPNVGKSSLFNRLISGTRGNSASTPFAPLKRLQQAIVSPQAGTTRDRKEARAVFGGLQLLLVDTGGLEDTETTEACELLSNMRKQVRIALKDPDCVLFLVDATEGITPVDILLRRLVNDWLDEKHRTENARQAVLPPAIPPEAFVVRASAASVAAAQAAGGGSLRQRVHAGHAGRVSLVAETSAASRKGRDAEAAAVASAGTGSSRGAALQPGCQSARQYEASDEGSGVERVPVILVVNKADGCFLGDYLADCYDLQLGAPVIVSAKKNEGMEDLYDRLVLDVGHLQTTTEGLFGGHDDAAGEDRDNAAFESEEDTMDEEHEESEWEEETEAEPLKARQEADASGHAEEAVEGVELLPEDLDRLTERLHPPRPSEAAGAWIEGLARRYGECGIEETYKHFTNPDSPQYISWDLSDTSLALAAAEAAVERKRRSAAKSNQSASEGQQQTSDETVEGSSIATCVGAEKVERGGGQELPQKHAGAEHRVACSLTEDEIQMAETELAAALSRSVEAPADSLRKRLRSKAARDYVLPIRRQLLFEDVINVAIIGRPNVGKSTLVNALLQEERMVVDNRPGTTTDAVGTAWKFQGHPFRLIDTAGVTRGWKMRHTDLLLEAGLQTLRNIRNSQVCILCIDASTAAETGQPISSHELALAHLASEKEGRCLAVCVTKWDLIAENEREKLRREILVRLQTGLGHLKGCPVVFVAAKHGQNLETLMTKIMVLYRRWNARIPTSKLNSWLREFILRWPPPWRLGSKCQVKYMTQVKSRPPTFVAWSNVYNTFPVHYLRQLTNTMREEFSLAGTPLRLILRTTAMPTPGKKLSRAEVLKWKRLGPKQHNAMEDLARGYRPKKASAATK